MADIVVVEEGVNLDQAKFIHEFEMSLQGVESGSLGFETKFQELEGWDSVAVLMVIGFIDIEFNTQIEADKLLKCRTIKDVYNLVADGH